MRTRHTIRLLSSGLALIVLALVWINFAPVGLGGSTTYVVTDGVSMEPRFHTGDLALVRSQSNYKVGEIVAYHSKMFHTIVLHRIIARAGSRYVFKGDNNNFVDFEHPARSQLIGSLWLHLPGVGARLQSLRSPALVGALVTIAMLLFTGAAFTHRRRLRRRQRRAGNARRPPRQASQRTAGPRTPGGRTAGPVGEVLAIGLLAMLPFTVLALLAFTRPTTSRLPFELPYRQSATFSYSAEATPGPAYPGNRAVTGDPLFTHVVKAVDLHFGYMFHSTTKHSLSGRTSLYATIASTSGWQTTVELGHPSYFRGDYAFATASLNLTSLVALLHSVETTTAVGGSYTLTLTPHVSAQGRLGALPLHTTYSPQVRFSVTPLEVQPMVSGGSSSAGTQPSANAFSPSASGAVTGRREQPLFLSFKLAHLPVATAREIALGGIATVILATFAILALARPRRRDEVAAIRARYGHLIIPVARVWQLPGVGVIDVADMEALVRIAEHYDRSVLYEETEDGEAFWVSDESGQFRYAVAAHALADEVFDQGRSEAPAGDVYTEELELGALPHRGRPAHA
jgi:signal peptidase I